MYGDHGKRPITGYHPGLGLGFHLKRILRVTWRLPCPSLMDASQLHMLHAQGACQAFTVFRVFGSQAPSIRPPSSIIPPYASVSPGSTNRQYDIHLEQSSPISSMKASATTSIPQQSRTMAVNRKGLARQRTISVGGESNSSEKMSTSTPNTRQTSRELRPRCVEPTAKDAFRVRKPAAQPKRYNSKPEKPKASIRTAASKKPGNAISSAKERPVQPSKPISGSKEKQRTTGSTKTPNGGQRFLTSASTPKRPAKAVRK